MNIDSLKVVNDFWGANTDVIAKIYTVLYSNEPTFKDVKAPTIEQLMYFALVEVAQLLMNLAIDSKGEKKYEAMEQARIRIQILYVILRKHYEEN